MISWRAQLSENVMVGRDTYFGRALPVQCVTNLVPTCARCAADRNCTGSFAFASWVVCLLAVYPGEVACCHAQPASLLSHCDARGYTHLSAATPTALATQLQQQVRAYAPSMGACSAGVSVGLSSLAPTCGALKSVAWGAGWVDALGVLAKPSMLVCLHPMLVTPTQGPHTWNAHQGWQHRSSKGATHAPNHQRPATRHTGCAAAHAHRTPLCAPAHHPPPRCSRRAPPSAW